MKKISIILASLFLYSGAILAEAGAPMAISTQELVGVCSDQSSPEPQIYIKLIAYGFHGSGIS